MAWAFQDPEHGSTTSKGSGAPTTTFVNPEYQPLATNRSQVSCQLTPPRLGCVSSMQNPTVSAVPMEIQYSSQALALTPH